MMRNRVLMVLMGMFAITTQALAQQKMVTGRVTSEDGAPLASVSVIIRGTSTGTVSNSEGNFSMDEIEVKVNVDDYQDMPVREKS